MKMIKNLPSGTFVVGNKLMGRCVDCGKLVQINKTIFGSLHLCLTNEEIEEKKKRKVLYHDQKDSN